MTIKKEDIIEYDISQEPPVELEVRVCVFGAEALTYDNFSGTSDVYFRGFFDSKEDV